MTRLAAHINDAGITLLSESRVIYREPGFALLEDTSLTTGNAAFGAARIKPRRIQHRFWSDLSVEPLPDRRFSHLSSADLVSRQLEQMVRDSNLSELVVAAPAYMKPEALGLLLGIAREIELPVVALVDAAVAATRREYGGAVPVHVDISLHSTTLSRLAQPGKVQAERSEVLHGNGTYALYDAWLNAVADAFVKQSRFDPLHTAETEQMLLDQMGRWLGQAAQSDAVDLRIVFRGTDYEAQIESLSLVSAAAPIYQQIASQLRALFRADEVPALQLSDRVARLPGLADLLKARVGGEVYLLEPGATARGALARCRDRFDAGSGVSLLKQLPWDQAPVQAAAAVEDTGAGGVPTHVLYRDTAWEIGNSPLTMGSEGVSPGRAIVVDADMPGVSRRHCTLARVNGQCVLEDFSRYGTFLNGHRIDGSTVLQIGDQVRIGSPGFEFRLITTDESHGQT